MKETIIKYIFIFIIALAVIIPGSIFLSSLSGCARVSYKDSTPSVKCNFALMMVKLKSIKGNEAFEVGEFVRECYKDLDIIKCKKFIYGDKKIDEDKNKKLEFLECLRDS